MLQATGWAGRIDVSQPASGGLEPSPSRCCCVTLGSVHLPLCARFPSSKKRVDVRVKGKNGSARDWRTVGTSHTSIPLFFHESQGLGSVSPHFPGCRCFVQDQRNAASKDCCSSPRDQDESCSQKATHSPRFTEEPLPSFQGLR